MRYSNIDYFEIVNGTDVGVSFYTQGCMRHCKGCFNQVAWDLDGGKLYTDEVRDNIVKACSRPGIKRFSILGGEPLLDRNEMDLIKLCALVKEVNPDIKIWIYTGDTFENIKGRWLNLLQYYVDVLVDGPFELDKRDITIKFRGSTNQRVIDVKRTINEGKIINYFEEE